ncbi:MAG: Bbp16 family capsid cement protein [Dehalococcoidia bacterium]|jgi:hypothetical protein
MICSELDDFCSATALNTGSAGTYLIGSQIGTGDPTLKDLGTADIYWVIQVSTAVTTSGGTGTVKFTLASDSTASVSTTTSTSHVSSPAFAEATLVEGYQWAVKLPSGSYEEFLGVLQTTATAAVTAGAVNVFFAKEIPTTVIYPSIT